MNTMVTNFRNNPPDANQLAFEGQVDSYEDVYLYLPEAIVFDRFRDQWDSFTVLDLGVGAGRTAWVFSPQAKRYIGIDYASAMIDHCRQRIPEAEHRSFEVGDARDLRGIPDQHFDFVIFSYNGLDYIDHENRQKALKEIRRVLKPGGWFFFSSHSLDAFPFRQPHPRRLRGILTPLGWAFRKGVEAQMLWKNRGTSVEEARERGWARLVDFFGDVDTYYIDPKRQVETLESLGFQFDSAWDCSGRTFDFSPSPEDWMVHYLFRNSESVQSGSDAVSKVPSDARSRP
jgi:SAM-dependent methyltransferase